MVPESPTDNDKSIIDWIRYTVACAFLLPCFLVIVVFLKYEGAWSMWLSLFLSRGIYIVLATLIFGCFIITFFKNKVQGYSRGDSRSDESWCSPQDLWKTPHLSVCGDLKSLSRTRIDLEERSGALEREKAKVEERLEEAKYQSALESESLRKEAAITQRQLQQVLEEKEMLSREVSSISRETRITESALKDQARLTTRLEEARAELNRLKLQMEEMKMERDTAVAIAADLAVRAQGAADDSAQLIGQWVRREMENRRKKGNPSMGSTVETDEVSYSTQNIERENSQNEKTELFQESVSTSLETEENQMFLNSMQEEMDHHKVHLDMNADEGTIINWDNEEPGDCLQTFGCGPVTSSAAFRDFLTAHYSQMPL
ncbi:unnamed protein product [Nezara viridula]|uniref:Uncharacterized protein n=1 Tax=Nezara viridula TaxID=85310 RepID=A0A9P0ML03_NEZVI|nr:unnamed protein product [Nezara viridula]